jgi:hypothetical protein
LRLAIEISPVAQTSRSVAQPRYPDKFRITDLEVGATKVREPDSANPVDFKISARIAG